MPVWGVLCPLCPMVERGEEGERDGRQDSLDKGHFKYSTSGRPGYDRESQTFLAGQLMTESLQPKKNRQGYDRECSTLIYCQCDLETRQHGSLVGCSWSLLDRKPL